MKSGQAALLLPVCVRPGVVTVLLLSGPPPPPSIQPSLLSGSEVDRWSVSTAELSPWAAMVGGFGGRGGGVGVEAWSSSESTLGVEGGR